MKDSDAVFKHTLSSLAATLPVPVALLSRAVTDRQFCGLGLYSRLRRSALEIALKNRVYSSLSAIRSTQARVNSFVDIGYRCLEHYTVENGLFRGPTELALLYLDSQTKTEAAVQYYLKKYPL